MFQYILVLVFSIELSRDARENGSDRCRVSHLYLMFMPEDEFELISSETLREHKKYISRQWKAHLTHIDREGKCSLCDSLIDHLHRFEESGCHWDDELGRRHDRVIHSYRGHI